MIYCGDQVKVEVTAFGGDNSFDPPFFLYLHRPGAGLREHLLDDGGKNQLPADASGVHPASGDSIAGDGIFNRTFTVPAAQGFHHLTIDALTAASINSDDPTNYQAMAFSVTVRVV